MDRLVDAGEGAALRTLLVGCPWLLAVLGVVRDVGLQHGLSCWVGAGAVRNLVWDTWYNAGSPHGPADFDGESLKDVDGELEVHVETTPGGEWCRDCGVRAVSHGRRSTLVRDLPVPGRPTRLRWRMRLWRCHQHLCPTSTWTERHAAVVPRAALTERAREEVCRRVGEDAVAVAEVARDFGVGWQTAMRAVIDRGQRRIDEPARLAGVTAVGLDETAFLTPTRDRGSVYVTGMVDVVSGRLLDVVEGRAAAVQTWLDERDPAWLESIREVTIDP